MNRRELAPAVRAHDRRSGPAPAAGAARRMTCVLVGLALLGSAVSPARAADEGSGRRRRGRRTKVSKAERKAQADAVAKRTAKKEASLRRGKKKRAKAAPVVRRGRGDAAREALYESAGVLLPDDLPLKYVWSLPFERNRLDNIWIHPDVILATSGNALYCIRKADGVWLWAIELDDAPQYPPAVSEQMVYVFVLNKLTAIDRAAGQILWRIEPSFAPSASPGIKEPNLYIAGWDRRVHAVMVDSKERVYIAGKTEEETLKAREYFLKYTWHKTTGGHVVSPPTIHKNVLYFGSEDGYLYAVTQDGEERYRTQTQGAIRAQVRVRTGKVYVGSADFNAYAFDRLTGSPVWIFPTGSDVLDPIYPDAAVGVAIVSSNKMGVYGVLDEPVPGRGSELWHIPDAAFIAGVGPKLVYLALADGRLAAVEKKTGVVEWLSMLAEVEYVVPQQNEWVENKDPLRLIFLSGSNHLVCMKEPTEELQRALEERK